MILKSLGQKICRFSNPIISPPKVLELKSENKIKEKQSIDVTGIMSVTPVTPDFENYESQIRHSTINRSNMTSAVRSVSDFSIIFLFILPKNIIKNRPHMARSSLKMVILW